MHIVLEKPRGDGFGAVLRQFCESPGSGFEGGDGHYLKGILSERAETPGRTWTKPGPSSSEQTLQYYSSALGGSDARTQVKINTDSSDFFDPEGETTGVSASRRIRGTVLHKILESVSAPEDLHASVRAALEEGLLSAEEAADAEQMLSGAIDYVKNRGWFPGDASKLLDEREIIIPDGTTLRPDRVVLKPDGVDIVDYKFAQERGTHIRQVRRYAELYRAMGYTNVHAYLWYVDKNEILTAD
jgi:hypothetical protein